MAFGFDSGIDTFFERRRARFENHTVGETFQQCIAGMKAQIHADKPNKPTVVILGAGPGGLIRTIQSLTNGNPTTLIEKRDADASGLMNTVALTTTTVQMLRYCGIYQYLIEKKLIYPDDGRGYIMVRLGDLRDAVKMVLEQINPDSVIQYNSKVVAIDDQSEKLSLIVEDVRNHQQRTIKDIDVLVNTEGKNSSTNALLGIDRVEVLPSIPVIAAIFKDRRPKIRGVSSLLKYMAMSVFYLARTINQHVWFLFRYVLSKNFRREMTGALILKTPKQNYVGCGFSDPINQRLEVLKDAVAHQQKQLEEVQQKGSVKEIKKQAKALNKAKKKYNSFAEGWIKKSICRANFIATVSKLRKGPRFCTGSHLSLEKFEIIKIGADHASRYSKKFNKTSVLVAGDAAATVDPTTGLGCNTAIQSSVDFLDFLWDYDAGMGQDQLLSDYSNRLRSRVTYIHHASKMIRSAYRPDALMPTQMRMSMPFGMA